MIIELLLIPSRISYCISSSVIQLSLFNILLQILLLPYAYCKTDIYISDTVNNSGNTISNADSLLSSLPDDILNVYEPIKNIIGGNKLALSLLFYF